MNSAAIKPLSLKYCGTQALTCIIFCALPCEQSEFGYYQAHHSKLPNDGIASSEYVMNGPKPLGTKVVTQRMPTKITKYSWEDASSEVKHIIKCSTLSLYYIRYKASFDIDSHILLWMMSLRVGS
jgi:hypothetical protein